MSEAMDDDDLLIVSRADVDERGVSRLAREWWAAFDARVEAERAGEELADRRGRVSAETQMVLSVAKRRGTWSKAVRGLEKVGA